jgi:hypothetical protein
MRKTLLAVFIVATTSLVQAQRLSSFTHDADSVFNNLDKRYITTDILYDRVYPSAMLHIFNSSFFDTTNAHHFNQAYYDLYNAKYNKTSLIRPEALDKRIKVMRQTGNIPIGILNFKFNQIDTNAIADNLFENRNGIFYDVRSRQRSPYWKKQITLISPLIDSTEGLQINFQTSPSLYLQNTDHIVTSLRADFSDGSGLVEVGLKNSIIINYPSYGKKIIKFIIKYQDNSEVTTYACLNVFERKSVALRRPATACDRDDTLTALIPFTDYENNTFKGKGNIHYYFSTSTPCNGKVKKPIIILDGFDPGDQRSISQLYDIYMNNPLRYPFGNELRSKGYDIVVLNFPEYVNELGNAVDGGADYIERNAFVLIRLINKLNWQLKVNGSSEKLVIVGPSMGGVISRYALAYMEKHYMNHNTRLWISLDAPHNGANIPIGAQKFLEFFANNGNKTALETLQQQLNSPAAKQQLLHHYLSYSEQAKGAPGFRDTFATTLRRNGLPGSKGFPIIPRTVALVDGSLNGTLQSNSTACQQVLNSKAYLAVNLFLFKVQLFRVAQASIYFAGSYDNACTVLAASQVLKGNVAANGYAPAVSVSYDIAPGGLRTSFATLADAGKGYSAFFQFLIELGTLTEFSVYNNSHSFVSTKSALAFKGSNKDLAESVYERNLVCTGETPFNTYYGGTTNLEHSFIDSAMAKFAIDEITGKQRTPTYDTSLLNVDILGPDEFCDSAKYSLQGSVSPGTVLTWSVSAAVANIAPGTDSTKVRLTKIDEGPAILSLQITNECGLTQTVTKNISIGRYSVSNYPVQGPSSACNNQLVYFFITPSPHSTYYNWSWPSDWTYVHGQGTFKLTLKTGTLSGPVSVSVANSCDAGGTTALRYVHLDNCVLAISAAPNPTANDVTITTNQVQSFIPGITVDDKIYKLEVTDIFGNVKKKLSYSTGATNIKLNLGSLFNGSYIIRVYNGKIWAQKIIVIAH